MYVYFLTAAAPLDGPKGKDRWAQLIKIGSSADPAKRMAKLQTGSPVRLQMLGSVKCRDAQHARSVERLAHNIFADQRRRGEWFRLSEKHERQVRSLIARCAAAGDSVS